MYTDHNISMHNQNQYGQARNPNVNSNTKRLHTTTAALRIWVLEDEAPSNELVAVVQGHTCNRGPQTSMSIIGHRIRQESACSQDHRQYPGRLEITASLCIKSCCKSITNDQKPLEKLF